MSFFSHFAPGNIFFPEKLPPESNFSVKIYHFLNFYHRNFFFEKNPGGNFTPGFFSLKIFYYENKKSEFFLKNYEFDISFYKFSKILFWKFPGVNYPGPGNFSINIHYLPPEFSEIIKKIFPGYPGILPPEMPIFPWNFQFFGYFTTVILCPKNPGTGIFYWRIPPGKNTNYSVLSRGYFSGGIWKFFREKSRIFGNLPPETNFSVKIVNI